MSHVLLALVLFLAPLPPTGMFAWDPPLPIQQPLQVSATGGATTTIYVRADGDVASVNVRAPRHCYRVDVTDAAGQHAVFQDRRDCGLILFIPFAAR